MPVGRSGHIVVELDPDLKQRLHARLRSEGRDFKGWLLERVQDYLGAPQEKEGGPRDREEAASEPGEVESELTETEKRVLDAVSSDARGRHHVDGLVQATGLGIGEVANALLELELQGRVVQDLGVYRRVWPS
jgi:predicted Rossmann fold nucleotide-binding protein DprA/Smf involved in DNA uptake